MKRWLLRFYKEAIKVLPLEVGFLLYAAIFNHGEALLDVLGGFFTYALLVSAYRSIAEARKNRSGNLS